jgi:hypothetical protein
MQIFGIRHTWVNTDNREGAKDSMGHKMTGAKFIAETIKGYGITHVFL